MYCSVDKGVDSLSLLISPILLFAAAQLGLCSSPCCGCSLPFKAYLKGKVRILQIRERENLGNNQSIRGRLHENHEIWLEEEKREGKR